MVWTTREALAYLRPGLRRRLRFGSPGAQVPTAHGTLGHRPMHGKGLYFARRIGQTRTISCRLITEYALNFKSQLNRSFIGRRLRMTLRSSCSAQDRAAR